MLIVAGGDPWRTAFSDSPGYAQTTRRIIVLSFTSDKQKIKIWSNSIKEVLRDLNDNSCPDAGFASKLFMHGSIWPLSIPAPATSETSLAPRAREWGIVWSGPVPGIGGWGKPKIDFTKFVLFLAWFTRSCGTQDYIFSRGNAGICGRMIGEESPIKIKVCIC